MGIICPNLNIPQVKEQFDKLVDAVGETRAYLVWHRHASKEPIFNQDALAEHKQALSAIKTKSNKFLKKKESERKPVSTNIEAKKADIERRRKKELDELEQLDWESVHEFKNRIYSPFNYNEGEQYNPKGLRLGEVKDYIILQIHYKYDEELAALENKPTEPEVKEHFDAELYQTFREEVLAKYKITDLPISVQIILDTLKPNTTQLREAYEDLLSFENGFSRINSLLFSSYQEPPFRIATEKKYEIFDREKEVEWFKQNLSVPVEVIEGLINAYKYGVQAWGMFINGGVVLSDAAKVGTAYHEAFHVVFNMYLTPKQQNKLINDISQGKRLTRMQAEELLADKFMDYKLSLGEERTFSDKVNSFFAELLQLIKSFFNRSVSEELIFDRINRGYYKNFVPRRSLKSLENEVRWKVGELTNTQTKERAINVADEIRQVIDSEFAGVKNKSRSEFVEEFLNSKVKEGDIEISGLDALLKKVYINLRDKYIELDEQSELSDYVHTQFTVMLDNIIKLDENAEPAVGRVVPGSLGKLGLLLFAKTEGVTFKTQNTTYSGQDLVTNEDTLAVEENETDILEGWQIENVRTSRRDSVRSELRKELSYIRELDAEGNEATDKIGLPKYISAAEAFATIIDEMQDVYNSEQMVTKFESLVSFKPEYKNILNKLRGKDFRTMFYNAFQNTHAPYMVAESEVESERGLTKTTYKFFQSNKTGIIDMIINEWKNNFSNPSRNKTIDSEGVFVDNTRLKALYEKSPKKIEDLLELYNSVGISISRSELESMKSNVIDKARKTTQLEVFWVTTKPIVNKILNNENPYETERKTVYKSALFLKQLRKNLQESSHISIDNKPYYSHILSFFASKQINKLKSKEERDKYTSRLFYNRMPWLKRMDENPDFYQNEFKYAILEGKRWHDDNVGVKYEDMTPKDLEIVKINSFLAGDTDTAISNMTWYHMAPLADAGNSILIRGEKFDNETVVNYLYEVALGEWDRIQAVKKGKIGKTIQNFNDDRNRGADFTFMPLTHQNFELNNETAIKEEIRIILENEYNNTVQRLLKNGTITQLEKYGHYISDRLKFGTKSMNELLRLYVYNSFFANTQMIALFQGDPAFYKDSADFFKRAKEVWSPGLLLDVYAEFQIPAEDLAEETSIEGYLQTVVASGNNFKTTYLYDIEVSLKELGNDIEKAMLANNFSEWEAKLAGERFSKENSTDAQAIISLRRYRNIQIGLGRWDSTKNKAYYQVRKGLQSLVNFQPLKPFMFTHRMDTNLVVPTQNKNSEFILIPALAYLDANNSVVFPTKADRANGYAKYKSPRLARILDYLQRDTYEDNNFVDSVQFAVGEKGGTSAVKAGAAGVAKLENIDSAEIHVLDNSDYRLQVETPDHFTEGAGVIGTQGRRNIIADIEDAYFEGLKLNREQLIELYHDVVSGDIKESYEELLNRFGIMSAINLIEDSQDKAILTPILRGTASMEEIIQFDNWKKEGNNAKNYEKLQLKFNNEKIKFVQTLLLEEVWKRGLGEAYEQSLELENKNGKLRFKVPLFSPTLSKKSESLVGAIFKNKIVKQKMPGGAAIQFSGFGYQDDLEIIVENGRLKEVQIMLPFWMSETYPELMGPDGKPDIKNR